MPPLRRPRVLRQGAALLALLELFLEGSTLNACMMVNRCLRHQMPELWDGEAVSEPALPAAVRYGPGGTYDSTPSLPEEPMGNGEGPV